MVPLRQILPPGLQNTHILFGLRRLGLLFAEKEADYRPLARQGPLPKSLALGR
jgi:hypothetical protein